MSFDMKHSSETGARPYMPPEEKQRILNLAKELKTDHNDPESHFDTMGVC